MKKILLLAFCVLAGGAVFADDVSPVVKKDHEISINVFGVFLGSYTAQFEFVPAGDGLFSLGVKATADNTKFSSVTETGFQGLGIARLYPARYMQGFYIMAEAGYSSATLKDNTGSVSVSSVPYMAGLGWKWLINEFSIDLGLAYGKQVYLNTPNDSIVDLNSYPFNIAADFYVLVGYRF